MPSSDQVRLRHMLDAASEALEFSQNRSREDLERDRMLCLSLVHLLEIVGEAARGVSAEFRAIHSEIPWRSMAGMRDRLVHGYFDVNLDVVWQTMQQDLPPLVEQLRACLASTE
jgi:uncharacterized protein with HEPN domain